MGTVAQTRSSVFLEYVRSKVAIWVSRQLSSQWLLRDPASFHAMVHPSSASGFQGPPWLSAFKLVEEARAWGTTCGGVFKTQTWE